MHILHDEIGLPRITSSQQGDDGNTAVFTIAPLPNGYGMTLGNALRRVLLSSIPGAAITAVRIDGVSHEYTGVEGLKDAVLDFCLHLKKVAIKKHSKGAEMVALSKKGTGDILAKDIQTSSDVEILNPDYVVSTLGKNADPMKAELKIEKGVGYLPAMEQQKNADEGGWIYLDATFSPVLKAKYEVTSTRVGDNTNLDKLTLEITTNGSLTPEDAMRFSAQVLQSYFEFFQKDQEQLVEEDFLAKTTAVSAGEEVEEEEEAQESYTPIEVLNLSPRTLNALINGDVGSVEELVQCTPAKLENFRGFGKKAMDEVSDALAAQNLSLAEE